MGLFDLIKSAILWAFRALGDLFALIVSPIINKLKDVIPGFEFDTSFADSSWVSFVDLWFPVDFAVTCFGGFVVGACVVYTVNWLLGLIPPNIS